MRITIKQLLVFEAVARTGSVSKASEEVSVTQAAASMSLRDLEHGLGFLLFTRIGKRLALNDRGRRFQPKVKRMLQLGRELESMQPEEDVMGELTLGATQTIGNYILPQVCGEFVRKYPRVHIALQLGSSDEIAANVQNTVADIGFVETPNYRQTLKSIPWIKDRLVFFTTPAHPLAGRPKLSFGDLKDSAWILGSLSGVARAEIFREIDNVNVVFESRSMEAIKRAVQGCDGVGYASEYALQDDIARGRFVLLPLGSETLVRTFRILSRRDAEFGALQDTFMDFITTLWRPPSRAGHG